jgi:hypothetical protein
MPKIYSLEFYASKCIIEIAINGLFIFRSDAKNGTSLNYPFNTELIGKSNVIAVSLLPTILDNGLPSQIADIKMAGLVKKYEPGAITGPESGDLILRFSIQDAVAQLEAQASMGADITTLFPIKKSFSFDNEELSFKNRLVDAPIIKDEKAVLDYAEKLRDIIAKQDREALWTEYKPKVDDYALAYPQEFPDPLNWFIDFFKNDFFPGGPITNFKRGDIGLRSWCDGRVWELFVKPAQKFFLNQGLDGDINSVEVYVGMVDGKLRIIR